MTASRLHPALVLALWTLLVWGGRVHLIWADEELTVGGQIWRTTLALSFVGFGAATVVMWLRARGGAPWSATAVLVRAFAVWTIGVWVVRGTQILLDDHELGFVLVHAVLAVVSVGLALWADRAVRRGSTRTASVSPPAS